MMDAEFDAWYRREHPRVVNSLSLVAGSVDAAREATDEAFARALSRWGRVSQMDSPAAWTYRVALNVLRRSMRRRSRERQVLAQVGPSAPLVTALPQPEVWAAAAAPPERQRKVVVLRYVADLPEATIAEVLGMRRGTVASDLSRARAGLASTLQDTRPTPKEVPHGC